MSDWALYMHGIYRKPLEDILKEQSRNPELTLYLQPYGGGAIARLRDNIPSPEAPVTLYASTTDDLRNVSYTADIVGWEDKTTMSQARREELSKIIKEFQPTEGTGDDRIYNASENSPSMNLLHVRGMVKLDEPFSLEELIKISDGKPLVGRGQAGGFSYVRKPE